MRLYIFFLCVLVLNFHSFGQKKKLIWSDEFNYNGLPDHSKWSYDTGNSGWGNRELEYYTRDRLENARVENGRLIIEIRKELFGSASYTSARLVTKNKGDWKYGRVDVRAKLPKGKGIWPAIWMLSTGNKYGHWPHSGEIDIMENVGYIPDTVYGSIHTGAFNHVIGTQKTKGYLVKDLSEEYHVYSIDWDPKKIRFYIDNHLYQQFDNDNQGPEHWPFDQPFHLILNCAVGGNWGGKYGVDDSIFPQKMEIDWVRIYQ
jgi:beta-glucanase (GH16 family)